MKPIRSVLLGVFLILVTFSSVLYTACHKDKCNNVTCLNLGVCDGGSCLCDIGYEGSRCELLSRDKFVATFNGHDLCNINDTNRYHQYSITFLAIAAKPLEFEMTDFIGNMQDSAICTMQSNDSFIFSGSNNGTTYNGYGTLRLDTLKLSYKVQIDTNAYTCQWIGGSLW